MKRDDGRSASTKVIAVWCPRCKQFYKRATCEHCAAGVAPYPPAPGGAPDLPPAA